MKSGTLLTVVLMSLALRAAATVGDAPTTPVLVMPFESVVDEGKTPWVGLGVQQTLLSELAHVDGLQPVPSDSRQSLVDLAAAREAGKAAGAKIVVSGTFQSTADGVRLTGQVLDVESGRLLGGLKSTGNLRELFALQDEIAEQARRIVEKYQRDRTSPTPISTAAAPTTQPTLPVQIFVSAAPQQPQQPLRDVDLDYFDRHTDYLTAYNTYRPYDYDDYYDRYRYGYGYYGYGYPVYWRHHHRPSRWPTVNNPTYLGPTNIGGTISIGGSRGSGYIPPSMGAGIHR